MEQEILNSEIIKRSNIPLILDSYNDIFSSFDSRPFNEKALSDDFLIECKKAARDKDDNGIELVLAMPKARRNINDEFKIKKRLREHFRKHFIEKEKEISGIKNRGIRWVTFGSLLIFGVVYGLINAENEILQAIWPIFEVPGWFLVWEGMGKIFFDSAKLESDFKFYKKMSNCEVIFRSY